ncbi:MAG: DNA replication/repair protein RecF [Oscillospiraceae bacterium]
MILQSIQVENFRNIENVFLKPDKNLNIICGKNGQGKTNLLESIWLLTGSKSFRAGKDIELVKKNALANEKTKITAEIINSENEIKKLEILIKTDDPKTRAVRTATINDVERGKASNLAGILNSVVFSPEHLSLVKGAPDGRRKFIDACLCQLYPQYFEVYKRYTRVLLQKNALLKEIKKGFFHGDFQILLDTFDVQMGTLGSEICFKRQEFIKGLAEMASENYKNISDNKEKLSVEYEVCCKECTQKETLTNEFTNARALDIKAGFSTFGPHRDDLNLRINGESAKVFASQGQQRSVVLALKIAEAAMIEKITNTKPILLLDDVLSELDNERQEYLLTKIKDTQVFVTACDTNFFKNSGGITFEMKNGMGTLL